jgi:hypothetical protein
MVRSGYTMMNTRRGYHLFSKDYGYQKNRDGDRDGDGNGNGKWKWTQRGMVHILYYLNTPPSHAWLSASALACFFSFLSI